MTPKEKAGEIVKKYRSIMPEDTDEWGIKQCALICVEEIMKIRHFDKFTDQSHYDYWQEVEQEIKKL